MEAVLTRLASPVFWGVLKEHFRGCRRLEREAGESRSAAAAARRSGQADRAALLDEDATAAARLAEPDRRAAEQMLAEAVAAERAIRDQYPRLLGDAPTIVRGEIENLNPGAVAASLKRVLAGVLAERAAAAGRKRLVVDVAAGQVVLDGRAYDVGRAAAEFVGILDGAAGGWVPGSALPGRLGRPDRLRQRLERSAPAVAALIESEPGRGGGSRLTIYPLPAAANTA